MDIPPFIAAALRAAADSFQPLSRELSDRKAFINYLAEEGWATDPAFDDTAFAVAQQVFAAETAVLGQLPGADAEALLGLLPALVEALVAPRVADAAWPTPLSAQVFWDGVGATKSFGLRTLDAALRELVAAEAPVASGLLALAGVFDEADEAAAPASGAVPARPAYARRWVNWERIAKVVADPGSIAADVYHWNGAGGAFDAARLLRNLGAVLEGLPVSSAVVPASETLRGLYFDQDPNSTDAMPQLSVTPFSLQDIHGQSLIEMRLSLNAIPIPAAGARTGSPTGVAIFPLASGAIQTSIKLSDHVTVMLSGSYGSAPVFAEIRPGGLTLTFPHAAAQSLAAEAKLVASGGASPWVLLGTSDTTRVELSEAHLALACAGSLADPEFKIDVGLQRLAVVIDFAGGDSFLTSLLGDSEQRVEFEMGIGWSSRTGIHIAGHVGFDIEIPLHLNLFDVIALDTVGLVLAAEAANGLGLDATVSGSLALGPVKAAIDRVGLRARLVSTPDGSGNLGSVNIELGFKAPDGLGMSIDAGAVAGGGYLSFDIPKGEYAGVLALAVAGQIQIKAIGLLTTSAPGTDQDFSLLVIITVDFSPIQLGYGFTLNGVGGLAGFNRTMKVDALRDGIKNHTLDSILFPPDPVANASKIISDLKSVFPEAPGRFVFAPMVKIGWGQSVLLIEVGLAVELPSPLVLAIMGRIHLLLPPHTGDGSAADAEVVELHLDTLGVLDVDKREISIDAVLYDSRVVLFPITGGMALRIRWGDDPVFLLSVGGFNPRFTPPPGFPTLDRLGIQLTYDKDGVKAGLCLTSYLALTSGTAQFGARIDAYVKISIADLSGFLGFDALIEFSPFHMIVDIYGGVSVHAFGVGFSCDIGLTLQAFEPVVGDGRVTVDFFGKHEIPIHFAIGDAKPPPALPVIDPLAELVKAVVDSRNWTAALSPGTAMCVSLRAPTADEVQRRAGAVLAHPLGRLTTRQKVLPFGIALQRFGAATPATPGPFDLSAFTVGGVADIPTTGSSAERESFARGQFLQLSEDDKVSGPQFEAFVCGYSGLGLDDAQIGARQVVSFDYAVTVVDSLYDRFKRQRPRMSVSYDFADRAGRLGAVRKAAVARGAAARFAGPAMGIRVKAPTYTEMSKDRIDPRDAKEFDTYSEAQANRAAHDAPFRRQVVETGEFA